MEDDTPGQVIWESFGPFRDWLFKELPEPRTPRQIRRWWRSRRFAYNVIVLGVGFVSFVVFLIVISASGLLKEGEDAAEPMGVLFAWVPINICYTTGSLIEQLALRKRRFQTILRGPVLMAVGIAFSLFMVLLPNLLLALSLLLRLILIH